MKLDHFLTPYIKINSKWITTLTIRPESIKLLEENRNKLFDIGIGNMFLEKSPGAKPTRTKINK